MPGLQEKDTPEVTAEQVLDLTVGTLQEHLNLRDVQLYFTDTNPAKSNGLRPN